MSTTDLGARIEGHLHPSGRPRSSRPPGPPPTVADHELVCRIGAGGYGEVWLARTLTGQWRAVKVIVRSDFDSDRPYEREFRGILRFEPISRLHPCLVHVLHVGQDASRGSFHYVMELADSVSGAAVPGRETAPRPGPGGFDPAHYRPRTLSADLRRLGRLPVPEVLSLGVSLTGALGHIHRHGLVHRDVKPSNVIFVEGQPKLADVGLVVRAGEANSFVGTEGYIPPEGPGTVRADLFALGRVLYEAATGKDRADYPELPEDLDRMPDRGLLLELNEVVARLCAPGDGERYENAAEVAGDLNLILAGQSVREAHGLRRRLRVARRVTIATLVVMALAAGGWAFQGSLRRQAEQRAAAEQTLRERAVAAEQDARRQLYSALLEQARANRLSQELGQRIASLDAVRRAAAISNSADLRGEALAALCKPDLRFLRRIPMEPRDWRWVDPSFRRVAVARGTALVEIRDLATGDVTSRLATDPRLGTHLARWSADGAWVAFRRGDAMDGIVADLEVWDHAAGRRVLHAAQAVTRGALDFDPRGSRLLAGDVHGVATVWDVAAGTARARFQIEREPQDLHFAPDGRRFAVLGSASDDRVISIRDSDTGALLKSAGVRSVLAIEWHPGGEWVVLLGADGLVRRFDAATGTLTTLGQHKAQAVGAAFSPGGRYLITGGWEAELVCWDLLRQERAFTIGVNSWRPIFQSGGRGCILDAIDGVRVYEFEPPDPFLELPGESEHRVVRAVFSPDGRWLGLGRDDGFAVVNVASPGGAAVVRNACRRMAFAPDCSRVYAYNEDRLTAWDLSPGPPGGVPRLESVPIEGPSALQSVLPRERELVCSTRSGVVWQPLEAGCRGSSVPIDGGRGGNSLSPDGRWLMVWNEGSPVVRVHRLPGGERVASLTNRADVWTLAFAPGCGELAVATRAGVEFYDTGRWQETRSLCVPSERQSQVIFSPDGASFWHASDLRTAALRDARTLEPLLPLPAGMRPLALSRDGTRLAVSLDARHVQVWDLPDLHRRLASLGLDWVGR